MEKKAILGNELILAIDFDGTITTNESMREEALELREGAYEVLHRLHEDGVRLVLWTCRGGHNLDNALVFLEEEGLLEVFEKVNSQLDEVEEEYENVIGRKVGADLYIDDKNIFTAEVDWRAIEQYIYGE